MSGAGIGYQYKDKELQAIFKEAAALKDADILIHADHVDFDLGASLESLMDCYAAYDKVLVVNSNDPQSIEQAGHFFRGRLAAIKGVYDLKKPFAEAKIPADTLPAALQASIRKHIFEQKMHNTPWYGKLGLLTEARREAAKASISIPLSP